MKKTSDGKHWAHMLCAVYLSKAAFLMPYAAENIGAIDENGKRSGFETVLSFHACKNGQKCDVCNKDTGAVLFSENNCWRLNCEPSGLSGWYFEANGDLTCDFRVPGLFKPTAGAQQHP